jgi:hypothetical protein
VPSGNRTHSFKDSTDVPERPVSRVAVAGIE